MVEAVAAKEIAARIEATRLRLWRTGATPRAAGGIKVRPGGDGIRSSGRAGGRSTTTVDTIQWIISAEIRGPEAKGTAVVQGRMRGTAAATFLVSKRKTSPHGGGKPDEKRRRRRR